MSADTTVFRGRVAMKRSIHTLVSSRTIGGSGFGRLAVKADTSLPLAFAVCGVAQGPFFLV